MTEVSRLIESLHHRTAALERHLALQTSGGVMLRGRLIERSLQQEFYDKYHGRNPQHKFVITDVEYDDNAELDVRTKEELLNSLQGRRFEGSVQNCTVEGQPKLLVTGGPRPRYWRGRFDTAEEAAQFIDGIINDDIRY